MFCYEIYLNEPKIYISLEKDSPNGFVEIWKAGNKMKVTLINLKIAKLTTPASNFQLFVKTFFLDIYLLNYRAYVKLNWVNLNSYFCIEFNFIKKSN